jgi:hypothetical protein
MGSTFSGRRLRRDVVGSEEALEAAKTVARAERES